MKRIFNFIKNIETNWQEAWNRHDMKALAALVAEDVDFIAVGGTWLKSRKDFEEHHAKRHEMQFKESIWTTTEVKVKFLKRDIAVVHVNWYLKGDKDPWYAKTAEARYFYSCRDKAERKMVDYCLAEHQYTRTISNKISGRTLIKFWQQAIFEMRNVRKY